MRRNTDIKIILVLNLCFLTKFTLLLENQSKAIRVNY